MHLKILGWAVLLCGVSFVLTIEQSSFGRVVEFVKNMTSIDVQDSLDNLNKRGFHSQITMLHDDIGEYSQREFVNARLFYRLILAFNCKLTF